jgi:hypothetical protein
VNECCCVLFCFCFCFCCCSCSCRWAGAIDPLFCLHISPLRDFVNFFRQVGFDFSSFFHFFFIASRFACSQRIRLLFSLPRAHLAWISLQPRAQRARSERRHHALVRGQGERAREEEERAANRIGTDFDRAAVVRPGPFDLLRPRPPPSHCPSLPPSPTRNNQPGHLHGHDEDRHGRRRALRGRPEIPGPRATNQEAHGARRGGGLPAGGHGPRRGVPSAVEAEDVGGERDPQEGEDARGE